MEINKPGGFLLAIIKKLEKNESDMIDLRDIERKVKSLDREGIVTYRFRRGYAADFVSEEIYDDLGVFEDIGWLQMDYSNPHCKLTPRGRQIAQTLDLPEPAKAKFNIIFECK